MSNARNLGEFAIYAGSSRTVPTVNLPNVGAVTTASATAAAGTINFDVITQSVLYYTTDATANWTLNVRGDGTTPFSSFIAVGQSVNIKFMSKNGATAYRLTALNIDGSPATISWAGGTAPTSGTANSIDIYEFTVICTAASTYTVLGQVFAA